MKQENSKLNGSATDEEVSPALESVRPADGQREQMLRQLAEKKGRALRALDILRGETHMLLTKIADEIDRVQVAFQEQFERARELVLRQTSAGVAPQNGVESVDLDEPFDPFPNRSATAAAKPSDAEAMLVDGHSIADEGSAGMTESQAKILQGKGEMQTQDRALVSGQGAEAATSNAGMQQREEPMPRNTHQGDSHTGGIMDAKRDLSPEQRQETLALLRERFAKKHESPQVYGHYATREFQDQITGLHEDDVIASFEGDSDGLWKFAVLEDMGLRPDIIGVRRIPEKTLRAKDGKLVLAACEAEHLVVATCLPASPNDACTYDVAIRKAKALGTRLWDLNFLRMMQQGLVRVESMKKELDRFGGFIIEEEAKELEGIGRFDGSLCPMWLETDALTESRGYALTFGRHTSQYGEEIDPVRTGEKQYVVAEGDRRVKVTKVNVPGAKIEYPFPVYFTLPLIRVHPGQQEKYLEPLTA